MIPNPVFIKRETFPEILVRRKVIVNVGRLDFQKNQELFIRAFSKIHEKYPEYSAEIYGEGILEEELKELASILKLTEYIHFMGTTTKLHERILDAAFFVLTSDFEGLPNALIEAMALGIPCISTDCKPGGARELIHTGEDGVVVPVNDVEQLSEAMLNYIENPDWAESLGRRAAINIQRYAPLRIYDSWEKYMSELIKRKKNG